MKRIANSVAVQTLAYVMKPNQLVTIIDYPTTWKAMEDQDGVVVFDDEINAINSYKFARVSSSKVVGVQAKYAPITNNEIIVIKTCQAEDQF